MVNVPSFSENFTVGSSIVYELLSLLFRAGGLDATHLLASWAGPSLSAASLFGGSTLRLSGLGLFVVFVTYRNLHISVFTRGWISKHRTFCLIGILEGDYCCDLRYASCGISCLERGSSRITSGRFFVTKGEASFLQVIITFIIILMITDSPLSIFGIVLVLLAVVGFPGIIQS